jgi:protein-tyrosine phosphatase
MAYWIETGSTAKLAIMPRPRGGDWLDDEIRALKRDGVDVLVSLLTPEEELELGLESESAACSTGGIEFRSFPIPDRQVPSTAVPFLRFIESLHQELLQGRSIAAHCRAGIGRSSLLLASLMRLEGHTVEDAFRRISQARGLEVPDTPEQVSWVKNLNINP